CLLSHQESRARHDNLKAWEKKRNEYLLRASNDATACGPNPPGEGWTWSQGPVRRPAPQSPQSRRRKRVTPEDAICEEWVHCWVPPELGTDQKPYVGGPLPFSAFHELSLADCYLVTAAVHDSERRNGRINPFPDNWAGQAFFCAQQTNVGRLSEADTLTLDD